MNLQRQLMDVESQEVVARSVSWISGKGTGKGTSSEPQHSSHSTTSLSTLLASNHRNNSSSTTTPSASIHQHNSSSTTTLSASNQLHNSSSAMTLSASNQLHNSSSTMTLVACDDRLKRDIEIAVVEVKDEQRTPHAMPPKHGSRWTRYLHYNFFTSYRKSFALIFMANVLTLIGLSACANGIPKFYNIGKATSVNLMVSILFRQENFVNLLYEIFTRAPKSFPLYIRRKLAKVFHYGGFHSGSAVAAVAWYLLYTVIATKDLIARPSQEAIAIVVTSYIIMSMMCIILVGAYPRFRQRYHDHFEVVHRFLGWSVLVIFWIQTYFTTSLIAAELKQPVGIALVESPSFWCLLISTCCVISPWLRLRSRQVSAEVLSGHATRLHFKYSNMKPFYNVRVSTQPLLEWHSFHTIPNAEGGFSVVVSNAGDWTEKAITEPPKKLWVRGDPAYGLLVCARLFKRIVIVATGSGIGPCLSLMYADLIPSRILWSTPKPRATYGEGIINAVRKADPDALIWDTRAQGRPDLVELTHRLYVVSGAEAIFIISNPKVTKKVVYGMETRGIAAYGAIFDS